jgi:hypothetical protein
LLRLTAHSASGCAFLSRLLLTLPLQSLLLTLLSHCLDFLGRFLLTFLLQSLGAFGLCFAVHLLSARLFYPAPLSLSAFLHLPLSWLCLRLACSFLSDKIFNSYQHNHCYNAQCNDLLKHFLFLSKLWPLFIRRGGLIPPHRILMFSGGFKN